jgi:hypothetical protein
MARRIVVKGESASGKTTLVAERAQRVAVVHVEFDAPRGLCFSEPTGSQVEMSSAAVTNVRAGARAKESLQLDATTTVGFVVCRRRSG